MDAAERSSNRDLGVEILGVGLGESGRRFRCSEASLERGESLVATASTVSAFLLIEEPGPWGPEVLQCYRLPDAVRARCARWEREWGVRPLLMRRPGRTPPGPRRIFVVNARHGWAETALVDELDAVADLDLSGVRSASGVGLEPHPEPLLLVCTHGRHDACCAEQGRPLASALRAAYGDAVWECSHLGGDRFAANLLILPGGYCYGRLGPDAGVRVVADHLAGRLDLAHFRGRTTVPWVVQFAEQVVRERLGESRVDAVATRLAARGTSGAVVQVAVGDSHYLVDVEVDHAEPTLLTCRSVRSGRPPRYRTHVDQTS